MQTIIDNSYGAGAIPFNLETGEINIFLIHQSGSSGDVYWTFPKGHAEEGESKEETARREVVEETGLQIRKLYTNHVYTSTYTFQSGEVEVNKTVDYFLAETARSYELSQPDEVAEAGWFTAQEAEAMLTFPIAKNLLKKAIQDIQNLNV